MPTINILIHLAYCTCCGFSVATILTFLQLVALGLILAVILPPRQLTQYQLYQNDIIECSYSSSIFTRILYSSWKITECPNSLEQAYDDINATVIPLNGGKKSEDYESVSKDGTFAPGRYVLPYPSVQPSDVQNRYMVEDSTVTFDMCVTPQHASSSPFLIALFDNYTYFASFVRSGDEYDVQQTIEVLLTQSGQEVCKNYSYTVEKATYLYFAFYTPVNVLLNMTTELGKRQYVESSTTWKYNIRDGEHVAKVPISLWSREKVLCHSATNDLYRDRTHICSTPVLRVLTPIMVAMICVFVNGLILIACCCRKRCMYMCVYCVRGKYRRLQNTSATN